LVIRNSSFIARSGPFITVTLLSAVQDIGNMATLTFKDPTATG
jgi:hypothetical protein